MWYAAEQVDPGEYFKKYAVLGDDIVIADARIAGVYAQSLEKLGLFNPKVLNFRL